MLHLEKQTVKLDYISDENEKENSPRIRKSPSKDSQLPKDKE